MQSLVSRLPALLNQHERHLSGLDMFAGSQLAEEACLSAESAGTAKVGVHWLRRMWCVVQKSMLPAHLHQYQQCLLGLDMFAGSQLAEEAALGARSAGTAKVCVWWLWQYMMSQFQRPLVPAGGARTPGCCSCCQCAAFSLY